MSLSGSFLEEYFENGRRYCSQTYYMPNDDEEQTRLAIAHQAYLPILDGQLTLAQIPRGAERILDIGTGTGDWAIAVAERSPDAEIIATDITSAFQPATGPPNVFFELDDAQEEWSYAEPFDFIHMRAMSGAFSDWDRIYAEVVKHLKPGGYFEIVDCGALRLKEGSSESYVSIYNGALQSAAEKSGRPLGLDHLKKPVLQKAGLSVVKSKIFEVPLGAWPNDPQQKVAGKMAMITALEGLEAASLRLLTQHMGWKEEEVRDLCEKVKLEILNGRAYCPYQFVMARKLMI
jgi:SAM-dependent methyltransferase